jgi:hypothetical protein
LFVTDDYESEDAGSILGGWSLNLSLAASAVPPTLLPPQFDGNTVRLTIQPGAGAYGPSDLDRLTVLGTTNLIQWMTVPGTLSLTNGNAVFLDEQAGSRPQFFYQVTED